MKLKLLISGEDKKICITPENKSDEKLLEFIVEHDGAKLDATRKHYSYDNSVEKVHLTLRNDPVVPEQKIFAREDLIKALQENRHTIGKGHGNDYWQSVADIVERFL